MGYLDENGLARLWNKITSKFISKDEAALKEIYVGSTVLVNEIIVNDNNRHNLAFAYEQQLINGLFNNIDTPSGYRRAFRLSAVMSTNLSGKIEVGFNGVNLISCFTYSDTYFRKPVLSEKFYSWAEFPSEPVYRETGLNLYAKLNSPSTLGIAYGIMIHGYFEKIS